MMNSTKKQKTPTLLEVTHYFFKMGLEVKHAEAFFLYYDASNWQITHNRAVRNWKSLAFNWVCSFQKSKPSRKLSIRY